MLRAAHIEPDKTTKMEFSNPFARSQIKARPTFHTTNTMNTFDEHISRTYATANKIHDDDGGGPSECRKKIKLQPCSNAHNNDKRDSCSKPKPPRNNNAKRSGTMLKRVLKMIKLKASARQAHKKSTKLRSELKKRQSVQNTACSINRDNMEIPSKNESSLTDNEQGSLTDNGECKNESKTVETSSSLTDNEVKPIGEKLGKNCSFKDEDISTDEIQDSLSEISKQSDGILKTLKLIVKLPTNDDNNTPPTNSVTAADLIDAPSSLFDTNNLTLNTLASNISVLNKVIKELEARVDKSLRKTSNRNSQKYKVLTFTQKTLSLIKYPLILGMTGAGSYFMASNYIYEALNLHYGNIPSAALSSLIFAASKVMSSFL